MKQKISKQKIIDLTQKPRQKFVLGVLQEVEQEREGGQPNICAFEYLHTQKRRSENKGMCYSNTLTTDIRQKVLEPIGSKVCTTMSLSKVIMTV